MKLFFFLFSLSVSFLACVDHAEASPAIANNVIQCPVAAGETEPPDFNSSACEKLPFWRLDPQQRQIWVKASINASDALLDSDKPLGVFISAKASSEVFLNGRRLGQNGAPASSKNTEIPGRMDAVFFAPREALRHGDNDIVIRMSSHHGFLHLNSPVHWIALGEYANPTMLILNVNWPSLIPFGALIAGTLYFTAASFSSRFRFDNTMLALISLFAAGQLFAEVYRGLFSYDYPAHDWRMIIVLVFSLGFGLSLIAHIINKYMKRRRFMTFGAVALFTIVAIFLAPGFDGKTALAILTPAIASVAISGFAAYKRQPQAMIHFAALLLFAMTIIIFPDWFLNTLFFYEVAALLLVLFVTQAFAFAKERKQHEDEQMRSQQLASALERAQQDGTANQLKISAAGKIDVVRTDEISHCKGAGDYVEICLKDGREILHSGSLAQLEESLPATFLRVHRSYLVNTNFIRSLTRESSGAGQLLLTTDSEIPVSRRIMPRVRIALG
jgi:DNA-binding LytR/AlgR family response regulator